MENCIRFQPTKRNGVVLIKDGFCYIKQKNGSIGTEYWTCDFQKIKCPGRGKSINNRKQFNMTREHNHLPDLSNLEKRSINQKMKEAAAVGGETTSSIVQAVLIASDPTKISSLNLNNMKRNVQNYKNIAHNQVSLSSPQKRDDINIPTEFQSTEDESNLISNI